MNRKEILLKKFPEVADQALAIEDFSCGKNKYLLWIASQLKEGQTPENIAPTLKFFHENIDRFSVKDIFKYKTVTELEDIIKEMGKSKRQEKEEKKDGAEKIFEDDDFLVMRVDTKQAMIIYGSGTRWCTTMEDATYYEDYVANGNEFYIVVGKTPNAKMRTKKYAVVRRGLLSFEVYDDKDSYAREFSEEEGDALRRVVQAIVADKPPKNMLRIICHNLEQIAPEKIKEWLEAQPKTTKNFVEQRRPDLLCLDKPIGELAKFFCNYSYRRYISNVPREKVVELAKFITAAKDDRMYHQLRLDIAAVLRNTDDMMYLIKGAKAHVRKSMMRFLPSEKIKEFINDRSVSVFQSVVEQLEPAQVLDLMFSEKISDKKKKICVFRVLRHVDQGKLHKMILSHSKEEIKAIMAKV
jgi:hypothetical protein